MSWDHKTAANSLVGIVAAADYSSGSAQNRFVSITAANTATLTGAGARADAICYNKPASGDPMEGVAFGFGKVTAGAAVAAGAEVMSDATGRAVTATSTNRSVGVAINAGAAAGDLITVKLGGAGRVL